MTLGTLRPRYTAGLIIAGAALCALLLALPGQTVTSVYVNDLFIFLDGAHRIASGQVPNRDFHTPLGPLNFYLPALGYWLSGTFGGAMPTGMALVVLGLAPVAAHVLVSRLHPILAVPFGAFVILILAVPMNLGESIAYLSFAMFYNRIGWAALAILLVMVLRPVRPRPGQDAMDAACAAVLTLVMLYMKATYGLAALMFLAFVLTDPRQRRWAALAVAAVALAGLLVEAVWRSSWAHISDLALTSQVSGSRGPADLLLGFLRHIPDYTLFAVLAALSLWRTRSLRDALFFAFCAGPGLLVLIQNSQPWGIISLQAGAAVAAELLMRSTGQPAETASEAEAGPDRRPSLALGAPFLLAGLLLPTILHCAAALGLHAALGVARAGEPFGLPNFDRVRLVELWTPANHAFSSLYLKSLRDGARALASLDAKPDRVSVLDFVSPFSAGLGLAPPRGDSAWLHWERNVNEAHFLPPENLLGGVDVLMTPKTVNINSEPLVGLYSAYIGKAYDRVRETEFWTVYRKRERQAGG